MNVDPTPSAVAQRDESREIVNVADHLPLVAALRPEALAVAVAAGRTSDGKPNFERMSCLELDRRSNRIAHALASIGIGEGTRTVVMVKPSTDFFALTFALFKLKAVIVLVDPGMGAKNLGTCLAESRPTAFIGIPKAHAARVMLRWASKSLKVLVTVGARLAWGGHTLTSLERKAPENRPWTSTPTRPEQPAAILFTSGSTGVPKGAVYSHSMFAAQVRAMKRIYGIVPGEVDLSTFPLFALFGPALGMASVVPQMDASRPAQADPKRLLEALEAFMCTNMFASPALVEKLGNYCEATGARLFTLQRVISAGAPAVPACLQRLREALPDDARIHTPYGATEALPVSDIASDEILEQTRAATEAGSGVCVGRPAHGMEVAIIGISDDPIDNWSDDLLRPPGEIGEIVVHGDVVSQSYYNREQSTRLAKIWDQRHGVYRHRMGDLGYFDDKGRLWMCGRKSQRVITPTGETMFTVPCESVFNTHPQVRRSALVGVPASGGQRPVICIELQTPRAVTDRAALRRTLLKMGQKHDHTRPIQDVLFHREFPVDVRHNAKIFREQLADWAATEMAR